MALMTDLTPAMIALDDEAWLNLLIRSIDQREIDGVRFPAFPGADIQRRYVGTDYADTLREAARFHALVKPRAYSLGMALTHGHKMLDFGCGWGRFMRYFWRDVGRRGLYGCDVGEEAVALCRELDVPGTVDRLYHFGRLPYADGSMDLAIAYSVFTHLPEKPHRHWLAEIARVLRPGGVFALTLEPRRFLDHVANIPTDTKDGWARQLLPFGPQVPELKRRFDSGEIAFLPTGVSGDFSSEFYGDAAVPLGYVERHWSEWFVVREYVDDPTRFFQAVLVVQRK
jgi:ubiquinone/menaquinone biosynthesis C-methylase UbiE